jgi:acyl transferase domain-containing protein/short-subunit dehydrogenase
LAEVRETGQRTDVWVICSGDADDSERLLASLQAVAGADALRIWAIDSRNTAQPDQAVALAQVAATELQANWGALLVVPQGAGDIDAVLAEVAADAGEDAVRLQGEARRVCRLYRREASPGESAAALDPEACYWISGGTGGMGIAAAEALIARGARHLTLISRRGEAGCVDFARKRLETWRARGMDIDVLAIDITHAAAVAASLERQGRPVRGLIHAAGVEDYGLLAALTPERLDAVLRPKVEGLEVLVAALASQPLDFVLALSSVAAIWGGIGSLHYAAANAWIDAWAHAGKASGKPYVSLRLGPVSGTGMMDAARSAQLRQSGLITLHRSRAIDAIDRALATTHAVVTACDLDEERFQTALQLRRSRPLLEALRQAGAPVAALRNDRWRALGVAQREADIWALLERGLREVLRLSEAVEIPPDRPAQHLGIDSLLAIEVRDRLAALFELVLPTTFVYDHPTPAAMHAQLTAMLVPEVASPAPVAPAAPDSGARGIAVIGMACRFPGGANDPEQFWQLLHEGRCAIDDAPERFDAARWKSLDRNEPGRAYTVSAGLIDDVDLFAADFFGIPAHEALCMDPQHRLVLETAWETIERAGYRPDLPALRRTGVFVGIGVSEYGDLLLRDPRAFESAALVPPGNCINAAAGRVSFVFDFQGPSIAVDTACSSSLVALQQAVEALRRGDCDYALAGGVNLALNPEILVLLCKGNMLGERGRCAAFSADADGYVRGEGCGMLLLKPLAAAQRDGDPILGVVRGCAVNQNGRSGSLTVPNGSAQQAVLRAALADAGVSADMVGHVEAHGTGTPLGDPVELHAIAAVYGAAPRAAPLQVGAVKSNIGHLEAAAGIAGVIKSLLCLQHGQWVPSLHFSGLNPNIQIDPSVVRICTDAAPLQEASLAAVSSFGFSGTNAHVILAPAPPDERRPDVGSPDLFVLSARSPAELRGHAARMRDWLAARPLSLAAVSATVRHSRAGIGDHRLAIACRDMAGLIADLAAFVDGRASPTQCQAQQRQRRAQFIVETVGESGACPDALAILPAPWSALAAAWLDGWSVEWPASPVPRVTLPGHPLRRERFWPVSSAAGFAASDSRLPGRRLRVPGSTDFRYVVPVTAQQPAHVRDHRIFGEVLLAGASHVAAILCAARASLGTRPLLLRDIAFEEALTPGSRVLQWQIALQPVDDHFTAASYSYFADDEQEAAVRHLSAELHLPEHEVPVKAARRPTTPADLDAATLYATLDGLGYRLGASFRWLAQGWRDGNGTLWQLRTPPLREAAADFVLYPGLIDSCFIAVGECIGSRANAGSDVIFVPFSVAEVVVWRSPRADEALWCQVWADPIDTADGVPDQASGGAVLFGANGDVIARIGRFRARRARRDALHQRIAGAARQLGHRRMREAVATDETPDTAAADEAVARCEAMLLDAVRTGGCAAQSEALAYCIALVGSVTAQPVENIDSRRSPTSLGVDSLMAIDLRRRLMRALGIDLDAVAILDATDLAELAARVLNRLTASLGTARSTDAAAGARASLSSVVEVEL